MSCVNREVALGSPEKLGERAAGPHLPGAGPHRAKAVPVGLLMVRRPQSEAQEGQEPPLASPLPSPPTRTEPQRRREQGSLPQPVGRFRPGALAPAWQ